MQLVVVEDITCNILGLLLLQLFIDFSTLLICHIYSIILQQIEKLVDRDVKCSVVNASLDAIKDLFSHWSEERGAEQLMCGRLAE
jgi:hypothetical protein